MAHLRTATVAQIELEPGSFSWSGSSRDCAGGFHLHAPLPGGDQGRTHRYRETITSSIATNGKIEALNNFEAHAPMATTVRRVAVQLAVGKVRAIAVATGGRGRAQLRRPGPQAQLKGAEAEISAMESGGTKEEVLTTRNALVKAAGRPRRAQKNLQGIATAAAEWRGLAGGSGRGTEPAAGRRGQRESAAAKAERLVTRRRK